MSLTGRFNTDFRKESNLPNADLPRDTQEDLDELAERLPEEEDSEE